MTLKGNIFEKLPHGSARIVGKKFNASDTTVSNVRRGFVKNEKIYDALLDQLEKHIRRIEHVSKRERELAQRLN